VNGYWESQFYRILSDEATNFLHAKKIFIIILDRLRESLNLRATIAE
jgi:hypothetical protein